VREANRAVRFVYVFPRAGRAGENDLFGGFRNARARTRFHRCRAMTTRERRSAPGLQAIIRTGEAATEGPIPDQFGVWVTGYAHIDDAPGGRHIIGIDVRRLRGGGSFGAQALNGHCACGCWAACRWRRARCCWRQFRQQSEIRRFHRGDGAEPLGADDRRSGEPRRLRQRRTLPAVWAAREGVVRRRLEGLCRSRTRRPKC